MRKYFIVRVVKSPFFMVFIFLSAIFLLHSCQSQSNKLSKKIVFVGDLLLDRGVRERINHLGIESLFDASIDSVFEENDIVIANLECPATNIKQPINKKYIFRANPAWLLDLKKHGITHLNLANNHSMDQGRSGLVDTELNILKNGLIPLGFGENVKQACKEKLIATEPRNIYVFSSLRVASENWIYLENSPCVCEKSISEIAESVKKLKENEPKSIVIVQLHWGAEHTLTPVTSQKQAAHLLINSGADGIIGHHTHTVQTVESYKGKPIYYSIGNFIFDQSNEINKNGLMIQLTVKESTLEFENIPFEIEGCVPKINNIFKTKIMTINNIAWSFSDEKYTDQEKFNKEVTQYQIDIYETADKWKPEEICFDLAEINICYEAWVKGPEDLLENGSLIDDDKDAFEEESEEDDGYYQVEINANLKADNGKNFSALEFLYKAHNAQANKDLGDHVFFEGTDEKPEIIDGKAYCYIACGS